MTNRKSHTCALSIVPKTSTSNDPELLQVQIFSDIYQGCRALTFALARLSCWKWGSVVKVELKMWGNSTSLSSPFVLPFPIPFPLSPSLLPMRSDWFLLVIITFWQMIHCSLQTGPTRKPCCGRNLQRHRAVLPAIAQLSCWINFSLSSVLRYA